jgi:hypothetical protein
MGLLNRRESNAVEKAERNLAQIVRWNTLSRLALDAGVEGF